MEKRIVYADNAATTPLSKAALAAMLPWLEAGYGNPSSIYRVGDSAKRALEAEREKIAALLGAKTNEIYFTSGGTEADNWAIKGAAWRSRGKHIIVSAIEHHAVLHAAHAMERFGFKVTELPVDKFGLVSPAGLEAAIRPDTALISIMLANNEIGTIQPIAELAKIAKEHKILFHTDAVQAVGHIPLDVKDLGVDMLSLSAHKFHGPKGIGALYVRSGVRIENLLDGGGHERGRRSGTESVALVAGMSAALAEAVETMNERIPRLTALRDKLMSGLIEIPYTQPTGHPTERLPGTASVVINAIEGESIVLGMDSFGVSVSSGSACTSGSLDPSHVLLSIGLKHEIAHGSMRLTLADDATDEDIDYIIYAAKETAARFRSFSPVWDSKNNKPL